MTANRSAMSTTRMDTQITLLGAALVASWHTAAGAHIEDLFVVKSFCASSSMVWLVLLAGPGRPVVGWMLVREWLFRRAGARGVSRPRWSQSRSPIALPGRLLVRASCRQRRPG